MTLKRQRYVLTEPELLHRIREKRGLSTHQLAASVGVSPLTVRRWEQGTAGSGRGIPPEQGEALLTALGLHVHSDLIGYWTAPDVASAMRALRSPAGQLVPAALTREELGLVLREVSDRLLAWPAGIEEVAGGRQVRQSAQGFTRAAPPRRAGPGGKRGDARPAR
jgi:DNA-binding XRE family transcriptional regulator